MARVEINNGGHQVIVDDPNGQRADVARQARKLWAQTRLQPGEAGFKPLAPTSGSVSVSSVSGFTA